MKRLLATMLLLAMVLTMCALPASAAEGERITVTAYWTDIMNPPSGRTLEYINDKFNIDLQFIITPIGEWSQRINLDMASQDMEDIMQIRHDVALTQNLIDAGLLFNMTELIDKYPTLKAYVNSDAAKPYAYWSDGEKADQLYAIPREWVNNAQAMYYRKDLLDKYDLAVPVTVDEYYEAMKTIVENEPSMVGISNSLGGLCWTFLVPFNGYGYTGYVKVGDKYQEVGTLDETKEGLKYMRKLYEAKIIDPEFMVIDHERNIGSMPSGKAASFYHQVNSCYYYDRTVSLTESGIPGAEVVAVMGPKGTYDSRPTNDPCADVWMCISADCADPERVMAMWDWLWSPEGTDFLMYGVEGVHWTRDAAGDVVLNDEEIAVDTKDMLTDPINKFQWFSDICSDKYYPFALDVEVQEALFEQNKALAVLPQVRGFASENLVKYEADVNKAKEEYFTKFITGELDIDAGWQEYIDAMYSVGLDKILEDVEVFMSK